MSKGFGVYLFPAVVGVLEARVPPELPPASLRHLLLSATSVDSVVAGQPPALPARMKTKDLMAEEKGSGGDFIKVK